MKEYRLPNRLHVAVFILILGISSLSRAQDAEEIAAAHTSGIDLELYSRVWVTAPYKQFQFRVKAAHDARIFLSTEPYGTTTGIRCEIEIGRDGNTQSAIELPGVSSSRVTQITASYLNENEFRDFWVAWDSKEVRVGRGTTVSDESMFLKTLPAEVDLGGLFAVGLDTSGAEGWWEFVKDSAPITYLKSQSEDAQGYLWLQEKQVKHAVFSLKGGGTSVNGMILLCSEFKNAQGDCFRVTLGNDRSTLEQINAGVVVSGGTLDTQDSPSIVAEDESRYFWVSWSDEGLVEVGEGHVIGYQRIASGIAVNPLTVTAIAVTGGYYLGSYWEFHALNDNNFLFQTTPQDSRTENNWVNVEGRHTFVFEVQSCSDAIIALQSDVRIEQLNLTDVVVIIGSQGGVNNTIEISHPNGNDSVIEINQQQLLSCTQFRAFWLSWHTGLIQFGTGNEPLKNEVFSLQDPYITSDPRIIRGLVFFDADTEQDIKWRFPASEAKSTTLFTGAKHDEDVDWLGVMDTQNHVFSVRSCNFITLQLSTYLGVRYLNTYDVLISEMGVMITKGAISKQQAAEGILSCEELHYMWLAWHAGVITMGQGVIPGEDQIISFDDSGSNPYEINAIAFVSEQKAEWHFGNTEGPYYMIRTNSLDFEAMWLDCPQGLFTFSVVACDTISVYISETPGVKSADTGFYITFTEKFGEIEDVATGEITAKPAPYTFDCKELKFWISWYGSSIRVGEGQPFLNEFVKLEKDPETLGRLKGVAVASEFNELGASWNVPKSIGKIIHGKPDETYPLMLTTDNQESQAFQVKAERDVTVILMTALQANSANSARFEVSFGAVIGGSIKTIITNVSSGERKIEDTPNILSATEFRWFWVSWGSGLIQVGKGDIVGNDRITFWQTPLSPLAVHYISVYTPGDMTSEWEFSRVEDKVINVVSTFDEDEHTVMRTSRPYFQFKVRACKDVVVNLLNSTEPYSWGYKFNIGAESDTRLIVSDSRFPAPIIDELMSDVLSCTEIRQFWISWADGVISLGRGVLPGYTLAEIRQLTPQTIVGIGLETLDDTKMASAVWEFSETAVNSLRATTESPKTFEKFWVTVTHQKEINVRVKSGGSAYLALSRIPEVTSAYTYEILLGGGDNADQFQVSYGGKLIGDVKEVADQMDQDHYRLWRVSWESHVIQVYRGNRQLLSVPMEEIISVASVSVASDNTAHWELSNLQGNAYILHTTNDNSIKDTWISVGVSDVSSKELEFLVLGDKEIKVTLVNRFEIAKEDVYEVIIGEEFEGKRRTYIKDAQSGDIVSVPFIGDILSATEGRQFWISWRSGDIVVGRGNNNTNEMSRAIGDVSVNFLGLTSKGDATWSFTKSTVASVYAKTEPTGQLAYRAWENIGGETHTVVNVKACLEASIILATTAFVTDQAAYRIDIQRVADGKTVITDIGGTLTPQNTYDPTLLDCKEYRSFWVRWDSSNVIVGKGSVVDVDELVRLTGNDLHAINALGVATAEPGDWYFLETWPDTYSIGTTGSTQFREQWFYVSEPIFTFRVQACSDVIIAFETDAPEAWLDYDFYEVIIGGLGNTKSYIRRRLQTYNLIEVATPNILSCTEYRQFWMAYNDQDGVLEIGTGDLYTFSFMSWTIPGAASMHAVSVATDGRPGMWEITQNAEKETFHFDYESVPLQGPVLTWVNVIGRQNFKFLVLGCEDVRLVLTATPGQYATLTKEVALGLDGLYSVVKDSFFSFNDPLIRMDSPGILSCYDHREFFLEWDSTGISVSEGAGGNYPFLRYDAPVDKPLHPINAIGLYSKPGKNSNWIIGNITDTIKEDILRDEYFTMFTYGPEDATRRMWNTMGTGFIFSVKAAESAIIYLSTKPGQLDVETFQITIGDDGNDMTRMKRVDVILHEVQEQTPGILEADRELTFWVSWNVTAITLGKGTNIGENVVLALPVPDAMVPIHSVAVATKQNIVGSWKIFKDSGRYFTMTTLPSESFDYKEFWVTSYMQDSVVFQLKACSDAYILLSDRNGEIDNVYEVVLGTTNNTISGVRSKTQGPFQVTETDTDLLSCDELRYFWVSWYQGVEVGRGRTVGVDIFLVYNDFIGKDINHVSFATGKNQVGEWHMHNSEIDSFTIRTPGDYTYDHIWVYPSGSHFEFEVTGCEGAKLLLAEEPLALAGNGYEITIGGMQNTRLYVVQQPGGNILIEDEHLGLLNCFSTRRFWVSWFGMHIDFGKGPLLTNHLLSKSITAAFPIRGVSMTADVVSMPLIPLNLLSWDFSKDLARTTVFDTKMNEPYGLVFLHWFNTYGTNAIKFKVMACSDARILLSEFFGLAGSYAYEVRIDEKLGDSYVTSIYDHVEGELKDQKVGRYLNEDYANWFWISWPGDSIHVGSGPVIENDVIVSWENITPKRHAIEAVAFESDKCNARWEFTELPDRLFEVTTLENQGDAAWIYMHRKYFGFTLQACANAKITLADEAGIYDNNTYVVILDGEEKQTKITYSDGTVLATPPEGKESVLNCDYQDYWISWQTNEQGMRHISVGDLYTGEIMGFNDDTPFGIHVLSLETSSKEGGHWLFRDDSGMTTRFFTDGTYNYESNVYRVASLDTVIIWVQAAEDAHVFLFDYYHTTYMYEIILGAENGNAVYILKERNSAPVAKNTTLTGVINDQELQPFWITWHSARIVMGRGDEIGKNEFISYYDQENPFSVSYMAFATEGVTGTWEFYNITDDTFLITTAALRTTDEVWFTFSPDQSLYRFSVRACQDAVVQLVSGGQYSEVLFDIIIGADTNEKTILKRQGEMVRTVASPDILHCYEDRWFILKWQGNKLELLVASENGRQLFTFIDDMMLATTIHGLTLHTEYGVYGEWALPRGPGKALRIHNGRNYADPYCCLWLTVLTRTYVVFSVKACRDASVILAEVPGVTTGRVYEIVIGADFNQKSIIREGLDDTLSASSNGEHLDCEEFRTFFVSWEDDLISLGAGPTPAGGAFLSYPAVDPFHVRGLSMATDEFSGITWEFSQIAGNQFLTDTFSLIDYNQVKIIPRKKQFVFGVKANTGVHLALSTIPGETILQTYEVIIGGNMDTEVDVRDVEKDDSSPLPTGGPILDINNVKYFWVTWGADGIHVGKGQETGNDRLYEYTAGNIREINAIALSTNYSVGNWEWDFAQEKMLTFSKPANPSFVPVFSWLTVVGYNAVVLRVRVCDKAEIFLAATQGNTDVSVSHVTITNNDLSYITNSLYEGEHVAEAYTQDILHCGDYRAFWIQWSLRFVKVGTGAEVGVNQFLGYEDNNIHYVTAIALANNHESAADWEILSLEGNEYTVFTPGNEELVYADIRPVWNTASTSTQATFTLMACRDAIITLLPEPESLELGTPYYRITLGAESNQKTLIHKLSATGEATLMKEEYTPLILNCGVARKFWVGWNDNGLIHVGSGNDVGTFENIRILDPRPVELRRLSLTSSNKQRAEWTLPQNPGDTVTYETPQGYVFNTTYISVLDRNHVKFQVAACQGAHIALSDVPGTTKVHTYEVVLGANDNKQVEIRSSVNGTVRAMTQKKDLVLCNTLRPFWISWGPQRLAVGRGVTVDEDVLLEFEEFPLESINTVSLATFTGNRGWWQFDYTSPDPAFEIMTSTSTAAPTTAAPTTQEPRPTPTTTPRQSSSQSPPPGHSTEAAGTDDPTAEKSTGGLSGGEQVGIAFGVIIALVVVAALAFFAYRYWFVGPRGEESMPVHYENPGYLGDDNAGVTFDTKDIFSQSDGY